MGPSKHIRKNISVPESLWLDFESQVPAGERSLFISEAIRKALKEQENLLAKEYEDAFSSEEYRQVQEDWGGLDSEGWE